MSRAYERRARADEIVDDYADGPRDVASEKVAGDDAGAAMLFRECFADRPASGRLQRFAEQVGPLAAPKVRRNDTEALVAGSGG